MITLDQLLDRLWYGYTRLNPHAPEIQQLLEDRGEAIVNDHIALRTFDDARVNIDVLSRPFLERGYAPAGTYDFPAKKLDAIHLEHPDPLRPKVFISQLRLRELSHDLQRRVNELLSQAPDAQLQREDLPVIGRPWELSFDDYQRLADESEYAGWLAAHGFAANHFTVLVNALSSFDSLQALNQFLEDQGYALNASGGKIKGSPADYLEQSSTLAPNVPVRFTDGEKRVPGCYYEFARRYETPAGTLFQGFVARSADKIFESTDRRE